MRFATRILIGVAATATVAVAAPTAASATPSNATSSSWGTYYSSDHKAKANGHVRVVEKKYKHRYTKTVWVPKKVCKWHDGDRKCRWVKQKVQKHAWVWKTAQHVDVHSRLYNHKSWGKDKCAWETFKVVSDRGHTSFERFKNCDKHPRHFRFSVKDAAHIYVNVSRGNHWRPTGSNSGWQDVYHAGDA